jgi:5-methylcytosine-specific restriction protein A
MGSREFRTPESYAAERITRDKLKSFFLSRGFKGVRDVRKAYGKTESQTIHATSPDGERLVMRVRLCWRRTGHSLRESSYSAAQLRARVKNNDWEGTLQT